MEIKKAEFVRSVYNFHGLSMPEVPQIALVGKSNVGKSSLINTVCNRKGLAKTSTVPGKTRSVNFFLINEEFYLVDLPGYGYAEVSKNEKMSWGEMMEGYFAAAHQLKHIFVLIDIRREPSDDDKQMAWFIQDKGIPCTIIATKADKVSKSQRKVLADKLSDALGMTFRTKTIAFSSLNGDGKIELIKRFGEILQG